MSLALLLVPTWSMMSALFSAQRAAKSSARSMICWRSASSSGVMSVPAK